MKSLAHYGVSLPEHHGGVPIQPMEVSLSEDLYVAQDEEVLENLAPGANFLYRAVFERAAVGLAHMDALGKFHQVNAAFCEILGYSTADLTAPDFDWRTLFASQELKWAAGTAAPPFFGEVEKTFLPRHCLRKDGRAVWVDLAVCFLKNEAREICGVVLTAVDATEQKHNEETIRQHAFYDGLTQLPNRRLLLDRLQQAIACARRAGNYVGVLFIDLDEFKPINDQLGHAVGDWLLQAVAKRLASCLRSYDSAARFGGDEFVVLLPNLSQVSGAMMIAERIRQALSEPFVKDPGKSLSISGSIGVALFPDHADSECDLIQVADTAMYEAKRSGRNKIVCPEPARIEGAPSEGQDRDQGSLLHLSWEAKYESGNDAIDGEHRELFRHGNQVLDTAMRADVDPAAFKAALRRLLGLVATHFRNEEIILKRRGYNLLAEHKVEHHDLLERFRVLRGRSDEHGISTGELIEFLIIDLISKHILTRDRNYFSLVGHSSEAAAIAESET
jgi:diguanylate cyclase (GGDEF)-like protein/hemerythrin-like metal-binding protein/PAS domain S-box-containing protein